MNEVKNVFHICPFCQREVCVTSQYLMLLGWGQMSARARVELWLEQHLREHVDEIVEECNESG